jgi:hypothetical protein
LLVIITNIHVKKTARRMKGNTGKYSEGGNFIIRIDGRSTVLFSSDFSKHVSVNTVHREQLQLPRLYRLEFFQIVYHLHSNLPRIAMLRCFGTLKAPSIALTCRNVSLGVLVLSSRSSKHIRCSLLQPNATLVSSTILAFTFSYLQWQLVQVFQKRALFDRAFPNWNVSASVRAYLAWHSNSYSPAHVSAHNFSSFMVPTRTRTMKKPVASNQRCNIQGLDTK